MMKVILGNLITKLKPTQSVLLPNYPNPFNPETWVPFILSEDGNVTIRIYDVSGRLVRALELGWVAPGYYSQKDRAAYWDGHNEAGEHVSSGVYFYNIISGNFTSTRKMVIIR